jgi:hypothetical protein
MRRDLGDGYELDDDPARIDRETAHRLLPLADVYVLEEHRGPQAGRRARPLLGAGARGAS